jgi:hypothetical protein
MRKHIALKFARGDTCTKISVDLNVQLHYVERVCRAVKLNGEESVALGCLMGDNNSGLPFATDLSDKSNSLRPRLQSNLDKICFKPISTAVLIPSNGDHF